MASSYRRRLPQDQPPLRRRAGALTLALGLNLLILLALLGIQASKRVPKSFSDSLVVDLLPGEPTPEPQQRAAAKPERARQQVAQVEPPRDPKPPPPAPPRTQSRMPVDILWMTKEEYAAANIAKLPRPSAGAATASGPGDSEQVGRGPNGQLLYTAEWARRPTDTELGGYLPRNAPDGYGMIACRTVAGHRVEEIGRASCRERV